MRYPGCDDDSLKARDWMPEIQHLRRAKKMHITHKPWTARYERASAARDDIAFESTPIAVSYDYEHKCPILVVWVYPDLDDIFFDSPGKYAAMRVFPDENSKEAFVAESVEVFAFYDGIDDVNDDEKNHRLFTVEEARELARSFANEVI
jgi:hypothetical protein